MTLELGQIKLKNEDLLFYKSFIKELGGQNKARIALLDIIDRYFNSEYINNKYV